MLLVNDQSLHGQFQDTGQFRKALGRLMVMRSKSLQYGRDLYCHRNLPGAWVAQGMTLIQAVQRLDTSQKRAVMQWLTRLGPFWDAVRMHSEDDYLECDSQLVTDTAIGEAAVRKMQGIDCRLVSLFPSRWEKSPLSVCLKSTTEEDAEASIDNYWHVQVFESALQSSPSPVMSWPDLAGKCQIRFPGLTFFAGAFEHLFSHPFVPGAALRILELLHVLDRFKSCFDEQGMRTPEGQRLFQDHFTGDKAWFSDSSADEKSKFKKELTFANPEKNGQSFFCPWHGKIKSPQFRIHFTWPVRAGEKLFVVYVGPKITKR